MNSRIAIISDLHSNIEALDAVLRDIEKQKVEQIICLGDIIGYGPNPREVIRHALNWKFTLKGNHEEALLFLALDFHNDAARAIEWTREQLNIGENKAENHQLWNFVSDLPEIEEWEDGQIMFVHASPRDYTKEYVRPVDVTDRPKLRDIFNHIKGICFYGHTHEPGIFTDDLRFFNPQTFANGRAKLVPGRKFYINVGSVGQPRDRDTRACYVVFDGETVEFRRIEYDFTKTMGKIFSIKEIPRKFGERLAQGK